MLQSPSLRQRALPSSRRQPNPISRQLYIVRSSQVVATPLKPDVQQQRHAPRVSSQGTAQSAEQVSASGFPRTAVVGVLGGGQLGRMMALAAGNMGVRIKCLDPTDEAPAAVASTHVHGHFRDAADISAFVTDVDVLTTEIEHIDVAAVQTALVQRGLDMQPSPETIRVIQDKYAQKVHFSAHGVPLPQFREVNNLADAMATGAELGFPYMMKAKRLAYDGKGNAVVKSAADIEAAVVSLGGFDNGLYAEQWAPFVKELAVMVVRSRDGSVVSYPVVETIHKDSICYVTEAPANVPQGIITRAKEVAEKAIACLYGAGIFGVEMFVLPDGQILLNEVAPRPHNSGHYTQNGCATSQFENHLRAVLGWPLGDTSLTCGSSLMLNLLGEAEGSEGVRLAHEVMGRAYATAGASVHWYGKLGMAKGRKVGHINVCGANRHEARARLARIEPAAAAALAATDKRAETSMQASTSGQANTAPQVGIIMGSDSDLATMKAAAAMLAEFGVTCEVSVVSAHRTPERMVQYARTAHTRGVKVIIAGAGGAAHLPGMVAAMTPLPVVGVPVKPAGAHLDGLDALLSIVQMPKGVPVATVAIGNAANAGLLALRILATSDPALQERMVAYQDGMRDIVEAKAAKLEAVGWEAYKVESH